MTSREQIEQAFLRARQELKIRAGFPPEVLKVAEEAAKRVEQMGEQHSDRTDIPFVTIDPPGSRDLDQALHIERAGAGYRVHYAIADVGWFVDRGSKLEAEAWLRGVTFYSPDHKESLYPEVLSQGAASLLPDQARPAILFSHDLDELGNLQVTRVTRAKVLSRAQLTYEQALHQIEAGTGAGAAPNAAGLSLLREVGERRRQVEKERGGVSLPIREQHVQSRAALHLGYELITEAPNVAEEWNSQISLLTGHAAAKRMLKSSAGLLRTVPPSREKEIAEFRVVAQALGFEWPEDLSYPEFIHALDLAHPNIEVLVWQARRVMRGADYVAFQGSNPENVLHSALAMPYAHCTAPLRRLADRYVLDLLVLLEQGEQPGEEEAATLFKLPPVMEEAQRKSNTLERRVVDLAEAWVLQEHIGERFPARVLGTHEECVDVQIEQPPVRARVCVPGVIPSLSLGERVHVQVDSVEDGAVKYALV